MNSDTVPQTFKICRLNTFQRRRLCARVMNAPEYQKQSNFLPSSSEFKCSKKTLRFRNYENEINYEAYTIQCQSWIYISNGPNPREFIISETDADKLSRTVWVVAHFFSYFWCLSICIVQKMQQNHSVQCIKTSETFFLLLPRVYYLICANMYWNFTEFSFFMQVKEI